MRDAEGAWEAEPGEQLAAPVSVEAALFWQTERPHLLMRPTSGMAVTSAKRLLFLAGESVPRTDEEPTTFNVSVRVPPTAVEHLFRGMGGRELIEVRREDLRGTMESRAELTVRIEAAWIGGPQPATFLLVLRPLAAAREAVGHLLS